MRIVNVAVPKPAFVRSTKEDHSRLRLTRPPVIDLFDRLRSDFVSPLSPDWVFGFSPQVVCHTINESVDVFECLSRGHNQFLIRFVSSANPKDNWARFGRHRALPP